MADYDDPQFTQIRDILQVVLTSPLFNGTSGALGSRTLTITTDISDHSVSMKQVRVNPEWATTVGPLKAAENILHACKEFDVRRVTSDHMIWSEWQMRLEQTFHEVEKRWGQDGLQQMVEQALNIGNDSLVDGESCDE